MGFVRPSPFERILEPRFLQRSESLQGQRRSRPRVGERGVSVHHVELVDVEMDATAGIDGQAALADLGAEILPGLYEREAEYLCREEWAQSAADILWRRTKLGLHAPPQSAQLLTEWLARR